VNVHGELLVELLVVVLVLCDLLYKLHAFLHDVLGDDLDDFVLLKHLTRDVEREIFRVNYSLAEVEVLGNEFLAVVHDEDTADVQLDVVLSLVLEVGPLWDEEKSSELDLSLQGEVLDSEMIFPVLGDVVWSTWASSWSCSAFHLQCISP